MNILITGGTSGLGRATVELLASDSAHHVYFTFLDNDVYRLAANELTSSYPNTTAIPLDFTDESAIDAFCNELPSFDLDVLVNSAYVGAPVSAILYECKVIETDIPYGKINPNVNIKSLMKIKLEKRYDFQLQNTFHKGPPLQRRNHPSHMRKG